MHVFHTFLKESYETTTDMKDKILFKEIFENFRLWLERKYGRGMANKYGQVIIYTELRTLPECPTERSRDGLCLTYVIKKSATHNTNTSAITSQSNISVTNVPRIKLITEQSSSFRSSAPTIIADEIAPVTEQPQPVPKTKVQLKILSKATNLIPQVQSSGPMRPPPVCTPFGNIVSIPITYPSLGKSKHPHV